MATVKFLLQSKSSNCEIYLRLSISRKQIFKRKTGLQIDAKEWSKDKGYPKQTIADNKKLASDLKDLEVQILKDLNNANSKGQIITGDWLSFRINLFFKRVSENNTIELLVDCVQKVIDEAPNTPNAKGGLGLSENTLKGYKDLKNVLACYTNIETLKTIDVNKDWIDDFLRWLKTDAETNNGIRKKYSHNTAVKKVDILKAVLGKVKTMKIPVANDYQNAKYPTINTYDDDTDVITLSLDELDTIRNTELQSEALINARKWLLLSCFTGQRGTALTTRITEENFEPYKSSYKITYKQKKGSKKVVIPVLPVVKEIYENGLPYKVSTQKLNIHFKTICKIAGIDTLIIGNLRDPETNRNVKKERPKYEYIATHTGRRSFASNHFNKLPSQVIMKVTGHTNYNTFLKYIQKNDEEHIDAFLDLYESESLNKKKESKLTVIKNAVNQ